MCKISIIVPVYNVEKYLNRCIDSILNQTFKEYELILVDDGSTDNSGKICDLYEKKDKRIKVIHKENGGLSSARNCGIEKSIGKYIGFVDSDDFIHPQMYSYLYDYLDKYKADISICAFRKVKENECIKKQIKNKELNIVILNNIEAQYELYKNHGDQFVVAWNKLYKRELFRDLRYEEGKIHEDEYIIHQILYKSKTIIYIKEEFYNYYIRENSIMNSKFSLKSFDGVCALKERCEFYSKYGLMDLKYKAEYNYVIRFFKDYYLYKNNVSNNSKTLYKLRKDFKSMVNKNLLKNPQFIIKEKLAWIIFIISPNIYGKYFFEKESKKCNSKIGRP